MDLTTFSDLLTPAGQDLLLEAQAGYAEQSAVALAGRLRRRHPPDLVAAALTQASLRKAAHSKWGAVADRMYFTRDGLEQATTGQVATYRANRFASALGVDVHTAVLADLCCGIGGDLLALGRAGFRVVGVDRDPLTVAIAAANIAAWGLASRIDVQVGEAIDHDRSGYAGVVVDPARRSARGRIFDPADFSPPWSFVEDVLGGTACVKTAPIIPHRLVPPGVEAEWISVGGEVKEAALWSGGLRSSAAGGHVRRRATVLAACGPGGQSWSLTEADDPRAAPLSSPREYLYEPDGAVIRSGLVTALVPLLDAALLHDRIAYLVSDRLVATPFATAYRVVHVLPYDVKEIRRTLRAREVGRLTIKKRGVDVTPEALRKQLGPRGPNDATLVVTRAEQGTLALLVEPVRMPSSAGEVAGAAEATPDGTRRADPAR